MQEIDIFALTLQLAAAWAFWHYCRFWLARSMERFTRALPGGAVMHAPIPETDMREQYRLPDER